MPVSSAPLRRDFFVYKFLVDGYPFYVGIGRAARASDRERYVRSLLAPQNAGKLLKAAFSVRVIAALLKRGERFQASRTRQAMTRRQALDLERKIIARLLRKGFHLTNSHHNPYRHSN